MSAAKLEEKHQKILRTLLQQPENKKCADCTAKGPVYANTTFNTFVCTTCSGIHREFNHRVKSVSMATFKPEEIEALQKGGNQVAHDQFMARWSPDDYPEPDSNDKDRIRQYIRLKYIDRRWVAGGARDQEKSRGPQNGTARKQPTSGGFSSPIKGGLPPKVEPLQNVLGHNIPPIRVEPTKVAPPPAQSQQSANSFFDPDFETNWNAPSQQQQHHTQTSAPVIDPFKHQETHVTPPQQQQQTVPAQQNPQDKAANLKNQINAMFSTVQQPQYPGQFQQFPGQQQQFPGQFPGQFPVQNQQFPGQFPQQQQFPGQFQQFPGQQQQFPGQQQQFPGQQQQFPGQQQQQQYPGQFQQFPVQQQQFPGQFPGQQQQQFPGQFPGQFPVQQQQFPGQFPGQQFPGQQQQQFPGQFATTTTASIAPIKIEPEKPDPFASLSLSSLSKQSQQAPKPSGPAMGTNPVQISPSNTANNDPFGFSTSPQKPANTGFNGNSMAQAEFNPFGMSQTSHVQPKSNDFNPFF